MQSVPQRPEAAALDQHFLARAFASFTEAAASLERSYTQLQTEVARLRRELEASNLDLARSLEENRGMRQRLDHILASLPCGVLVGGAGGQVFLANPEARRLLGVAADAPLHDMAQLPAWREPLGQAPPGGDEQVFGCCLNGAEEERARAEQKKDPTKTKEDRVEWVALRRAPVDSQAEDNAVFILRDVTEARRLEQEREGLRQRQALADISTMLAHEIRNPLASLELFAGLLVESELGVEPGQWATQLQAGLRTLAATVNNVLQFHSQPAPELVPLDLGRLLTSSVQFLGPLAGQAGVRLELDHQLSGVQVAADRHRLEQVVLNLALNAFRFMPQGGVLRISGGVDATGKLGRVKVEISDTGRGIVAENLPRIFQPGFTTRPGSPGLGLAVCRAVMEQHGGSIGVSSQPGRGTTFILAFPRLKAGATGGLGERA
jgi:signal transduction histidine kinase